MADRFLGLPGEELDELPPFRFLFEPRVLRPARRYSIPPEEEPPPTW